MCLHACGYIHRCTMESIFTLFIVCKHKYTMELFWVETQDCVSCKGFECTITQIKAPCLLRSKMKVMLGKNASKLQTDIFPLLVFFMNAGPKILFFL